MPHPPCFHIGLSRYGAIPRSPRRGSRWQRASHGITRRQIVTSLTVTAGEGFAVMSGIGVRGHPRTGQFVHPTRNFARVLRMSPCGSDHIFNSGVDLSWLAYGL